jgi:hypothetical protein
MCLFLQNTNFQKQATQLLQDMHAGSHLANATLQGIRADMERATDSLQQQVARGGGGGHVWEGEGTGCATDSMQQQGSSRVIHGRAAGINQGARFMAAVLCWPGVRCLQRATAAGCCWLPGRWLAWRCCSGSSRACGQRWIRRWSCRCAAPLPPANSLPPSTRQKDAPAYCQRALALAAPHARPCCQRALALAAPHALHNPPALRGSVAPACRTRPPSSSFLTLSPPGVLRPPAGHVPPAAARHGPGV